MCRVSSIHKALPKLPVNIGSNANGCGAEQASTSDRCQAATTESVAKSILDLFSSANDSQSSCTSSKSQQPQHFFSLAEAMDAAFGRKKTSSSQQSCSSNSSLLTASSNMTTQQSTLSAAQTEDVALYLDSPFKSTPRASAESQPAAPLNTLLFVADDLPAGMRRDAWHLNDYDVLQTLYEFKGSKVVKAQCKFSGATVVLKQYDELGASALRRHHHAREIQIHGRLGAHKSIIRLLAAFRQAGYCVMVLEWANDGDLFNTCVKPALDQGISIDERTTVSAVVKPLLAGLQHLHSAHIVHRDIKLENLLIHDGELKVADFGIAVDLRHERAVTRAGTLDYMAPEVLRCPLKKNPQDNKENKEIAYSTACDVWAVGAVAYEILNGIPPFATGSSNETAELIKSGSLPEFLVEASPAARDFVYACLTFDPAQRPSVATLLAHPWIKTHASGRKH